MTHTPTFTLEGSGVVVTCSCTWLRWLPDRKKAEAAWNEHRPKTKEIASR